MGLTQIRGLRKKKKAKNLVLISTHLEMKNDQIGKNFHKNIAHDAKIKVVAHGTALMILKGGVPHFVNFQK